LSTFTATSLPFVINGHQNGSVDTKPLCTWNRTQPHLRALNAPWSSKPNHFFVANTFQIQPFHKGLAKQTDVAFCFALAPHEDK
jgi:hypothetical protein